MQDALTCRRCYPPHSSYPRKGANKPSLGPLCSACKEQALAWWNSAPNLPILALAHRKVRRDNPHYEDFLQQLQAIYWRICVDYRPEMGSLEKYALFSLCRALRQIVRYSWNHGLGGLTESQSIPVMVSLDNEVSPNDEITLGEMIASTDEAPDIVSGRSELSKELVDALNLLHPRHKLVVQERFLGGEKSRKQVAQQLRVSVERVRQIEHAAKQELRSILSNTRWATEV